VLDRHDVKTYDRGRRSRLQEVESGETAKTTTFCGGDGLEWRAELFRGSRLHLAYDKHWPTPADQVDLAGATTPVPLDDLVAVLKVPGACRLLTQASQR
jgi:hypothetical protein